ncbi:MAG: dTMP kinase [Nanoarchaeota archaeon]
MRYEGKFIVLEGIDGAGTTTQTVKLGEYLFKRDKRNIVVLTREPTSSPPWGERLRRCLQGEVPEQEMPQNPLEWADLFVNDRKSHVNQIIVPAVREGCHVVCDHHMLSTLAYQSAQGVDMETLVKMHEGLYSPDLTLYFEIDPQAAFNRRASDSTSPEYFEKLDFQQKVALAYRAAVQRIRPYQRIEIIDASASRSIDDVAGQIQRHVDTLFPQEKDRNKDKEKRGV